jgi:lysine 2,3-aminomutase
VHVAPGRQGGFVWTGREPGRPEQAVIVPVVGPCPDAVVSGLGVSVVAHGGGRDSSALPVGVSRYYVALARQPDPATDPIAAQFMPTAAEDIHLPYETMDPLAEKRFMPVPRLIHRYPGRVLLLVCERCATYCRHCFRRHFTGQSDGQIKPEELEAAAAYIKSHPEIAEILISGGDPLMLDDARMAEVLDVLEDAAGERALVFRLATRMPVVLPVRITRALADVLWKHGRQRLWVVTQVNHPNEMTAAFGQAISNLVDRGIPVLNQSVLLRGVNNDLDVLATMFSGLLRLRVKPYYLFQGDLAAGTSHFRTTIDEGLDLMEKLRDRISGMAMPTYAVDLPDGGGKIALTRGSVLGIEDGSYILLDREGQRHRYPCEG